MSTVSIGGSAGAPPIKARDVKPGEVVLSAVEKVLFMRTTRTENSGAMQFIKLSDGSSYTYGASESFSAGSRKLQPGENITITFE